VIIDIFNNIESIYKNTETRKAKINKEYRIWIRDWKSDYGQLMMGLVIFVDKANEWEGKDEEMNKIYKKLIKKIRKHMKKLETKD
jgi:hypothetical protein